MKYLVCLTLLGLVAMGTSAWAEKQGESHSVSISEMKFSPKSLTISAGDTVVWTNSDSRDHTVVAEDGSFESPNLGGGDTFEHTFEQKGTFEYGCSYHPRMKGKIIVEN